MSDPTRHQHGLSEFEAALASLRPALPQLDRDELMFQAGRASVSARSSPAARVAWLAAAACLACVSLVLGISLVRQRSAPIEDLNANVDSFPMASDDASDEFRQPAVATQLPQDVATSDRVLGSTAFADPDVPPYLPSLGPPESYLELRNWLLVAGVRAWNEMPADAPYRYPRFRATKPDSAPNGPTWRSLKELYREVLAPSAGDNS